MAPKLNTNEQGKQALSRIRKIEPFIQGSLTVTMKRCGNPKCRCASQGPIHETALLTWKEGKVTKTLYVPISLRKEVAKWVEEGKLLKKLINEMSEAQRNVLQTEREKKKV
jgi:hypothetical protein